jgi:hypothetical protein
MKKVIVTTTINEPNSAIADYDAMEEWDLIVVGDKNGPEKYSLKRGRFISWQEQKEKYPSFCDLIGAKSSTRGRLIGFVEAHKAGADIVASIDDDNYPYKNWRHRVAIGEEREVLWFESGLCFDPLGFHDLRLYHRGFPIELVEKRTKCCCKSKTITPKLQANLWDGDPDVDAVLRIALRPEIVFDDNLPLVCGQKFMPVNTQNTFIDGRYLKDFCPLPFIGRHEDIWAGFIFQQIHPDSTVYGPATVEHRQRRTYTSLYSDLENELYGYKHTMEFLAHLSQFGVEAAIRHSCPYETWVAWVLYQSYFEEKAGENTCVVSHS